MSGYLQLWRAKKWKQRWFVIKGNVLYTYRASEVSSTIDFLLTFLVDNVVSMTLIFNYLSSDQKTYNRHKFSKLLIYDSC